MENSPSSVLRAKYADTFVAAMPSFKVKMFGKRKTHTMMWYTSSRNKRSRVFFLGEVALSHDTWLAQAREEPGGGSWVALPYSFANSDDMSYGSVKYRTSEHVLWVLRIRCQLWDMVMMYVHSCTRKRNKAAVACASWSNDGYQVSFERYPPSVSHPNDAKRM